MRAVLISTYDLGRQPFGLASPAAWLRRAGVEVTCVDVSREPLDEAQVAAASLVAFYLPMHTATRLAAPLIDVARRVNPSARLCAYGLYAPLNEQWLRERGITDVLGPEAEQDLFTLDGYKLKGSWVLVRTRGGGWPGRRSPGEGDAGGGDRSWLLIKHRDDWAGPVDIAEFAPLSVKSKGDFADILAQDNPGIWRSNRPARGGETGAMFEKIIKRAVEMRSDRSDRSGRSD
ncbi:MAG: hypothetical protein FJW14_18600, partial [Acidimicrobiia bacterium]|nr:hypothetical protein [Acidimicrobiia bacterium]